MIILPAIELLDGRCVSLKGGNLDEPAIWHVDPLAATAEFASQGAEWIHVTDFDGVQGADSQRELLIRLLRQTTAPIQLGGGFQSLDSIAEWIDLGAGRIVVGTVATQNPMLLKRAARAFPDQMVLAVDISGGAVMAGGWRHRTAFKPEEFILSFASDPLAGIIVTDIDADISDRNGSSELLSHLAGISRVPVVARGFVRRIEDIRHLAHIPHIGGAFVSRALFERSFTLEEAIRTAREAYPTGSS